MRRLAITLSAFLFTSLAVSADLPVREGDVIFQSMKSTSGEAIRIATHSDFSHVGVVLFRGTEPFVFEAVEPVKFTPLQAWIERGEGGRYVVRRLKQADSLLTDPARATLHALAKKYEGLHYDTVFGWTNERMYCSEVVWKMYKQACNIEVGRLQKLRDFDLTSDLVRKKLQERYGDAIPLDETVVSPQSIFVSELFETVLTVK